MAALPLFSTSAKPFIISTDTVLLFSFSDESAEGNYWIPVSPPGYRNVSHFFEISGAPTSLTKRTSVPIVFVRDDPKYSRRVTSYNTIWTSSGALATTPQVPYEASILQPLAPTPEYGILGHSFIRAIGRQPNDSEVVYAVRLEYLKVLPLTPRLADTSLMASLSNVTFFKASGHGFYAFPGVLAVPPVGFVPYQPFSLSFQIACCTGTTIVGLSDPGYCGTFWGPMKTGACDVILLEHCKNDADSNCGCLLSDEQYGVLFAAGPVECLDKRCTQNAAAYETLAQKARKCTEFNCVVNTADFQGETVDYQKVCGTVTGCEEAKCSASGESFFSFLKRNKVAMALVIIIGVGLFLLFLGSVYNFVSSSPEGDTVIVDETVVVAGGGRGRGGTRVKEKTKTKTETRQVTAPTVVAAPVAPADRETDTIEIKISDQKGRGS